MDNSSSTARRRPGAGSALLLVATLLGACGDDGSAPRPTATPPPSPTATAAALGTASPSATGSPTTPTATPPATTPTTPVPTATPTATRNTTDVALAIGSADGEPGTTVVIAVTLVSGGAVAGTQNDIGFAAEARIASRGNGRPDCDANPAIDKAATSFGFQPPGCSPDVDCTAVRALVLALDNVDPIPVGSTLYACTVTLAADARTGVSPLTCAHSGASDPDGKALPTMCSDGEITIDFFPIPTPTPLLLRRPLSAPISDQAVERP